MMHTDELRAELAELANEVDPFAENLPAIRRRVARRRALLGSIATLVSIALVVGVVAVTRSGPSHIHVAGTQKQVPIIVLPRVDALVVLPVGATQADADTVIAILDTTDGVEHYSPTPAAPIALALGSEGDSQAKALRAQVCGHLTSTRSFAVELTRPVAPSSASLTDALGNHATSFLLGSSVADLRVFMTKKASDAQVKAVREQLASMPDISESTFLDHEAAYRAFAKLFANQPELIAKTKPEDLPESFNVYVRDGASIAAVQARLQRLPAVDTVETFDISVFRMPPPLNLPITETEIFMQVKATQTQIDAVSAALSVDPDVLSYRFLTHSDALREFKRLFADQPALIAQTTAAALPTSFRVTLRDPGNAAGFQARYERYTGVDSVVVPAQDNPTSHPCAPNGFNP